MQFCYDFVADTDWTHFNTEYQNEPPAGAASETIEITAHEVMRKCNGLDRGTAITSADYLTAGIDMGARAVHWTVTAWKNSAGAVVDYGAIPVHSPIAGGVEDPRKPRRCSGSDAGGLMRVPRHGRIRLAPTQTRVK